MFVLCGRMRNMCAEDVRAYYRSPRCVPAGPCPQAGTHGSGSGRSDSRQRGGYYICHTLRPQSCPSKVRRDAGRGAACRAPAMCLLPSGAESPPRTRRRGAWRWRATQVRSALWAPCDGTRARLRHTTCAPHCHSTHSRAARRSHTHREPRYLPAHQIRLGDPLPRPVPSLPAH